MDFVMSPADLGKVAEAAMKIDANPLKLVGRTLGLGDAEMKAGIPTWAWVTLALGAGAFVGVKYGPGISRRIGL